MREITFDRSLMIETINEVADTIATTMGPGGRTVVIQHQAGLPIVTKDGATVAREIEYSNPVKNMIAQLAVEAALSANKKAGDGTTTATVLMREMVNSEESVSQSYTQFRRGMYAACKDILNELKCWSVPVSGRDMLTSVATISANGDNKIGGLVAEAFEISDGSVKIMPTQLPYDYVELVEGVQFECGAMSPYLLPPTGGAEEFKKPKILLTDFNLDRIADFGGDNTIFHDSLRSDTPLVIFANGASDSFIRTITTLRINNPNAKIMLVINPSFGDDRRELLEDLAAMTGATYLSIEKGHALKESKNCLGTAKSIKVSNDKTVILSDGNKEAIRDRIAYIEKQMENKENDLAFLKERKSRLGKGIALLCIGGRTQAERNEKLDRVEDAVKAVESALDGGVLPGGGIALHRCYHKLCSQSDEVFNGMPESCVAGYKLVMSSICAVMNTVMGNWGYAKEEIDVTAARLLNESVTYTYDIETLNIGDAFDLGLIEPFKVVSEALEASVSVAATLLSTDAYISYVEDNNGLKV